MLVGFFSIVGREEGKRKQEGLCVVQSVRNLGIGNYKMKNSRCETAVSDFLLMSTNVST